MLSELVVFPPPLSPLQGTGDRFINFTQSSFAGMGIVRTLLLVTDNVDVAALQVRFLPIFVFSTAS